MKEDEIALPLMLWGWDPTWKPREPILGVVKQKRVYEQYHRGPRGPNRAMHNGPRRGNT